MAQGSVRLWATLSLLALGACTAPAAKAPPPAPPTAPPPVVAEPAPTPPPPPPRPKDACGASELQSLIGKPRSEIPVPVDPSRRRVICSTCMVTQEFVPYRLTITYDAGTGLVTSVKCG
jgi:hypothetical protein